LNGGKIRTETGPDGEILHLVPYLPAALPQVTKRDLEHAWETARAAALAPPKPIATHAFRFLQEPAPPLDLVITDTDAASWAAAIDRLASLSTAHGISVCLRLLALFQLMATALWVRNWFTLSRAGLEFHPALLQAAALTPLTPTGGFAETTLQALLPAEHPAARTGGTKWSGAWPGQA
jgi:hypothetical protein